MPKKKKIARELAPREEQIMQVVFRLQRASVADVRAHLSDPPSYSAVRTMLGQLERKGYVRRDRSKMTHTYQPVQSLRSAGVTALRRLIDTFFPRSPVDALAALIDESGSQLSDEDINRLKQVIRRARAEE